MNRLFLEILNNAITVSWIIPVIVVIRLLLKKAPKKFICVLWAIVALRLCIPIHFESRLSLVPSAETIPLSIEMDKEPEIDTGVKVIDNTVNPVIIRNLSPKESDSVNPMQVVVGSGAYLWIFGVVLMAGYAAFSYLKIRKSIKGVPANEEGIYEGLEVETPFILGIVRPKIYIPSGLSEDTEKCVIAHERAHIKRGDHICKPFGFLLLTIYWFNPLMWLAYILLCKDIEYACDECAAGKMEISLRATYCQALLDMGREKTLIKACPVAFGETSVKGRIKSVINYRKPAFWIVVVCVLAVITVSVCFLTNPKTVKPDDADVTTEVSALQQTESDTPKETEPAVEEIKQISIPFYTLSIDFDGDNINETLELGVECFEEDKNEDPVFLLGKRGYPGYIRVFSADSSKKLYSDTFTSAHQGNGNFFLTEYKGKTCILKAGPVSGQGVVNGFYELVEFDSEGNILYDAQYSETWNEGEVNSLGEDRVKAFDRDVLSFLSDDAILLASCDIDRNYPVVISTNDKVLSPSAIYGEMYMNELGTLTGSIQVIFGAPLEKGVITSRYSDEHREIDFASETGTPVYAVINGIITETGFDAARGNYIVLDSTEYTGTVEYHHLEEIKVSQGDTVTTGTTVGTVGSTGTSTGPHLALSFRIGEQYVDPESCMYGIESSTIGDMMRNRDD